jgi:ABC-type branched-subunit amino acid transport system permease subunit
LADVKVTAGLDERAKALRPRPLGAWVRAWAPFVACIAFAVLLQLVVKPLIGQYLNDFYSRLFLDIGTNIILAVSLTMVNGFTGQFSIGHAAFMAVGAYTAADLVYYGSFRIWGDASLHAGRLSTMIGQDDPLTVIQDWTLNTVSQFFWILLAVIVAGLVVRRANRVRLRLGRYLLFAAAVVVAVVAVAELWQLAAFQWRHLPLAWHDFADLGPFGSFRAIFGSMSVLLGAGDWLFLASILAGGVVAALCGYLVGLPSLRLKGDYLAIVTLGFGEIVRVLIQQTGDVIYDGDLIAKAHPLVLSVSVGGALGFSGLPSYGSLFWAWLFAGITLLVAYRLKVSSYGRAFLSIREDEVAAEAMGIHTTRYKVRAFVIAAFFAGIAGGIFAHTLGVQLNPGELGFQKSFDIIIMVVLGGMGSISGASIAAVILTILPELLRDPPSVFHPFWIVVVVVTAVLLAIFVRRKVRALVWLLVAAAGWEIARRTALSYEVKLSDYRMVLYALALILMMILRPQGLLGVRELWELRRRKGATR